MRFSREHAHQYALIVVYHIDLEGCTHEVFWHEGLVGAADFQLTPVQWCGIPSEWRRALPT